MVSSAIGGVALSSLPGLTRENLGKNVPPSDVDVIELGGYETPGDAGIGARYVRGNSSGLLALRDGEGAWWNLSPGPVVWVGWFGALGQSDDTAAVQSAIDWIDKIGGGEIWIPSGVYRISQRMGYANIGAGDDGISHQLVGAVIPAESLKKQAYCLHIKSNVSIRGIGSVIFLGEYQYGEASSEELACCFLNSSQKQIIVRIENITFKKYFFGIGCLGRLPIVRSCFLDVRFEDCGIGFYANILERCTFDRISAQGTGCVILVGGQWATRDDIYEEAGGYADKCVFGAIHNIYQKELGVSEARIDEYFDIVFFRSLNNEKRLVSNPSQQSLARLFPFQGICGRAIYIMARHARPSNANTINYVSHAYAPRAAIWIDNARACAINLVYLESCGFRDSAHRTDRIGVEFSDPYLGQGRRIPGFIRGGNPIVDAQFICCERLISGENLQKHMISGSDILVPPADIP